MHTQTHTKTKTDTSVGKPAWAVVRSDAVTTTSGLRWMMVVTVAVVVQERGELVERERETHGRERWQLKRNAKKKEKGERGHDCTASHSNRAAHECRIPWRGFKRTPLD